MGRTHECVKCGRVSVNVSELFSRSFGRFGEHFYKPSGLYTCMAIASCKQRRKRDRQDSVLKTEKKED